MVPENKEYLEVFENDGHGDKRQNGKSQKKKAKGCFA
jgi:hypothetical protein